MQDFDLEQTVMELIVNAGQCKSLAFAALAQAKKGSFEQANELLEESSAAAKRAHDVQTGLIGLDEGEGKLPIQLIMVHAQDHIMTSMLAKELIIELIDLHKAIKK